MLGMFMMLSCLNVLANTASTQVVEVATPAAFQEQVRLGTPHIVITEHLDMTNSGAFSESTLMPASVISIVRAGNEMTQTIRVRSLTRALLRDCIEIMVYAV